jgi:outer membrane protein assembly factor BamB
VATGWSTGYTGRNYQIIAYDQDGTRRWETEPQDNFFSIVATHGGNVFVGTYDDHLVSEGETVFAIDSKGELQWQRGAGDVNGGTFAGGLVLYVDIDGVTAYDPARGRTVWEVAGRPISSRDSSVTVIDGLYFRDSERDSSRLNALIAHSITDGNEQWRYADAPGSDDTFDLRDVAAVPEGADGGGVDADIVGIERSGAVFALTKDDGSELWTFQADADTYDVDAVSDTVYVSDINGTVYALSLSDGQEQWRISLPDSAALWAVPSGVVGYCGGYEQTFASVAADGTERWSYKTTKDLTTPVVTDDRIYTYSSDGSVLAFIIDTK